MSEIVNAILQTMLMNFVSTFIHNLFWSQLGARVKLFIGHKYPGCLDVFFHIYVSKVCVFG